MRRLCLFAWLLVGLTWLPAGCSKSVNTSLGNGPIVRVKLLAAQDQVLLSAAETPTIQARPNGAPQRVPLPAGNVPVILAADGWRVGNVPFGTGELLILPASDGSVQVNGQAYRGMYRCVPVGEGKFDLINDLDVDSYLKGVLAAEMYARWDLNAYKAQAIVARTYALYEARTGGAGKPFDLFADTRSQVYRGIASETEKSRQAVDETAGIVVAYGAPGQERIFKAYFSSCCGGITQSAYDAFGDPYIEPLTEQNVGAMCNQSPKFNWGPVAIRKDELTRRIKTWGVRKNRDIKDMATLDRIDIQYVNRFGRPVRFLVTDSRGTRYTLMSEETRHACNTDAGEGPTLPSSFFKPLNEPGGVRFVEGHGFGHGVGMCQWCAQAKAERGMRPEDIVTTSYRSSKLIRAY